MEFVTLTDLEGRRAKAELSQDGSQYYLRLESGQAVSLPEDALVKQQNGDYYLLLELSELEVNAGKSSGADMLNPEREETVIPVAEERINVQKRQVEGDTVRITKQVLEHEEVVDEPLRGEEVTVERVKLGRVAQEVEAIRAEGDTTIIPLYEEVLVVEKRLVLVEELRVTKRQTERREPQTVTLRREEATVERLAPEEPGEGVVGGDE